MPIRNHKLGDAPFMCNIAPFSPGTEAELARDMIDYRERTGNDVVLYCLSLNAEGRPAIAKTNRLLDSYRRLKSELSGSEVRLGVLLQSTLGHWPIVGNDHEPWQRTVTLSGNGVRFCPLDPNHREFLRETVRLVALEHPALMMTDDDLTAFKPDAECFCPLHLAEFERRTGRRFTCDELRQVVSEDKDRALVNAFCQMQEDTVIGLAKLIREAIDSVDPSIPCCACMPAGEPWRAGRTATAVAADRQPPVLRLCNGKYSELLGNDFADRIFKTQFLATMWKDKVPCLLDESDTFPHNLWSKSARSFHTKLAAGFFCGLVGGKLWFVNARLGGVAVSRKYTDILAEHRGYYGAITDAVSGAERVGVMVPTCTDTAARPLWSDYRSGWINEAFAIYGIPFQTEGDYDKDGLWALAGYDFVKRRLSDSDLRRILSHRVLVDGPAAVALTERGFADMTGACAAKGELVFHREKMGGIALKLTPSDNVPELRPSTGARTVSTLVRNDAAAGSQTDVAPGATLFDNALGGRVAVTAWHPGVGEYNRRSEHRQRWIGRLLDELTDHAFPVRSADEQNTLVLAARSPAGSLLVHVFNLCYDPLETISLSVSEPVDGVEYLDNNGQWRQLDHVSRHDHTITLPLKLEMMEERVLKIEMPRHADWT